VGLSFHPNASDEIFLRYNGAWAEDIQADVIKRRRQDSLVDEPPRFHLMEIDAMTRHAGNLGGEP